MFTLLGTYTHWQTDFVSVGDLMLVTNSVVMMRLYGIPSVIYDMAGVPYFKGVCEDLV